MSRVNKTGRRLRVEAWLAGSIARDDRPTRAQLEACGYQVVPAGYPDPVDINEIARRTGREPVTVRNWRGRYDDWPPTRWKVGDPRSGGLYDWQIDVRPWLQQRGWWPNHEQEA